MRYISLLFLTLLLMTGSRVDAQDCKCLTMQLLSQSADSITVSIKNNCNRRMWFYTAGFWARQISESGSAETSVLKKMTHKALPEYLQFKWKEEKKLVYFTNIEGGTDKLKISYSNTEHRYPSRFLGAATFMCDKQVKKPGK